MHYNSRGFHFVQTAAGKQQLSDLWAVAQEAKCIFQSSGSLSAKHVSQRLPPTPHPHPSSRRGHGTFMCWSEHLLSETQH